MRKLLVICLTVMSCNFVHTSKTSLITIDTFKSGCNTVLIKKTTVCDTSFKTSFCDYTITDVLVTNNCGDTVCVTNNIKLYSCN